MLIMGYEYEASKDRANQLYKTRKLYERKNKQKKNI